MDVFSGMFATAWADGFDVRVNSDVDETQTRVSVVTGSMFTVLGLRPQVGRLLDGGDHVTDGAHPVIVISVAYWARRFVRGRRPRKSAVGARASTQSGVGD